MTTDVLVVGAGPCGITMANLLATYGVRAVAIDAQPGIYEYPRAVGIDDESLRTFQAVGIAQEALRIAIEWAKERSTFGVRLADRQAVQWQIADSEIELRAARLLIYQAAWKADLGEDVRVDASIAKLYSTEAAFRVVDRCMQILGALGLSRELPLERWFRDLRVKRLGEGATDIQRMVVARELLR